MRNRNDFWRAVSDGSTRRVLNCLKDGVDVNLSMHSGYTALHQASKLGNLVMVKYLIKKGADHSVKLNLKGKTLTVLDVAIHFQQTGVETYLKGIGAKSNQDFINENKRLLKAQSWTDGLHHLEIFQLAELNLVSKESFLKFDGGRLRDKLDDLQRMMSGRKSREAEWRENWKNEQRQRRDEVRKKVAEENLSQWSDVVALWKSKLKRFGINLEKVFKKVKVDALPYDNEAVGWFRRIEGKELFWWIKKEFKEEKKEAKLRFSNNLEHSDTLQFREKYEFLKGQKKFLAYLWQYRKDEEKLCALMIWGSLFPYVGTSRKYPFFPLKNASKIQILSERCWDVLFETKSSARELNDYNFTDILPYTDFQESYEDFKRAGSFREIIRCAAEEHISIFHEWIAVHLVRDSKSNPAILKIVKNRKRRAKIEKVERKKKEHEDLLEKKKKHPRFGEWDKISHDEFVKKYLDKSVDEIMQEFGASEWHVKNKLQASRELHEKRTIHPKWDLWDGVKKEELLKLVWSKPTKVLAKEFGISDVAISKKCKKLRIKKPPRGFWAKVEAGHLPHPKGNPLVS